MKLIKKVKKYYPGGVVDNTPPGSNETPNYSGYNWHANQLEPNFRAPYLQMYIGPDKTKTYVLYEAAKNANLPFIADTNTSEAGAMFDYSPDVRFGGVQVDPTQTYLSIDSNGRIDNTPGASIVIGSNNVIPVDNTWMYDPNIGWIQRPLENAQLYSKQTSDLAELTRAHLSTLGFEHAYNLDDRSALNLGQAVAQSYVDGALSVLGGEALSALGNTIKATRFGQFLSKYPRTTAFVGNVGVPAALGATEAKAEQKNDPISKYLEKIDRFTIQDFNTLANHYGSEERAAEVLLYWLTHNGFTTYENEDHSKYIEKDYNYFPGDQYIFGNDGIIGAPEVGLGMALVNRRRSYNKNIKKNKPEAETKTRWRNTDGTRTKAGKAKNAIGWVINLGAYGLAKAYFMYQKGMNDKADAIIDILYKKGYLSPQDSEVYNTVTDQNFNPRIEYTDSNATPVPYNEGQQPAGADTLNENYYEWTNDTAQ